MKNKLNPYHKHLFMMLIFMLTLVDIASAQHKRKVSLPEALWAIRHPFVANKAFKTSKIALTKADSIIRADSISKLSDGKADALTHCIWMAMLCREIDSTKAIKLGIAHEKGNYKQFKKGSYRHDSTATLMDLSNNQNGISVARLTQNMPLDSTLAYAVLFLQSNRLYYILRNEDNEFVDHNGKVIQWPPEEPKWFTGRRLNRAVIVEIT
jgi:hypothetical protein